MTLSSKRKAELEKSLRLISAAWGRKQSGYVFFPWIDRQEQIQAGSRRAGFHEGKAFLWPRDKSKIIEHMAAHEHHDLYWSASLFEKPVRDENQAMNEHALWADLDEADPHLIDSEYRPTIAWESSPGRYQALWVAASGDFMGASWPGKENQRLTYMIGADPSGWDTVQLLRFPGWGNHKPEYMAKDGTYPEGKLLWSDGPKYHPGDFADLPEVTAGNTQVTDALEADIDGVDRHEVIARVRLKLTKRARDMLTAREVSGDRSDQLWYLTRCLADVGCSTTEIVAIVRETVWNKFRDRGDELRRLLTEAAKAIAKRSDENTAKIEAEEAEDQIVRNEPQRLGFLLKNVKRPKFLIDGILTEGACGFIAGEPKCFKSWVGLDLAMSIATGAPFLGQFKVTQPGPVLYIQEEDPAPTLKSRSAKIWVGKSTDTFELIAGEEYPELMWLPPEQDAVFDPDINAYIQEGVTLSSEAWQIWLDEILTAGMDGEPYKLLLIDTLMMTAGDVEENRSQEMTNKIFKPIKTLSRKHNCALLLVHHMAKAEKARPGQRMLGSVANHAWAEDSIYLSRSGMNDIRIDLESKTAPGGIYRMKGVSGQRDWNPLIQPWREDESEPAQETHSHTRGRSSGGGKSRGSGRGKPSANKQQEAAIMKAVTEAGAVGLTTAQIADLLGVERSTAHKRMTRLLDTSEIDRRTHGGSNQWFIETAN